MIDRTRLRRLLLIAAVLSVVSAGAALAVTQSVSVPGGLLLGFLLGAAPFASWAWILSRGLSTRNGQVLTIVLLFLKLGLYSGMLYLLVTRDLVHPVGVLIGITGVVGIMTVGILLPAPAKAGEAA